MNGETITPKNNFHVIENGKIESRKFNTVDDKDINHIGVYQINNAQIFNHSYIESNLSPFLEPGVLLPYVTSMIRGGHIDWVGLKQLRSKRLTVNGPAAFFGSGAEIYGDWLVEVWPRAWLLKKILGPALDTYKIIVTSNTPKWSLDFLCRIVGISPESLLFYDMHDDVVIVDKLLVPTQLGYNYIMHPAFSDFIQDIKHKCKTYAPNVEYERIYISRKNFRSTSTSIKRTIDDELVEAIFRENGFNIISPETFSFDEQVSIFKHAKIIAGEAGSALHNSMFCENSPSIIMLGPNEVQAQIAAFLNQNLVVVMPQKQLEDDHGTRVYEMNDIKEAIASIL